MISSNSTVTGIPVATFMPEQFIVSLVYAQPFHRLPTRALCKRGILRQIKAVEMLPRTRV
jgi:hypothetical protein